MAQLEDSVSVVTGALPWWVGQLAAHAPFLFSAKTRKHLFRCTSNGQGFTLHWMQEARLGPYMKRRAQLQGELNSIEVMMDAR